MERGYASQVEQRSNPSTMPPAPGEGVGVNLNETLNGLNVLLDRLRGLNGRVGQPKPMASAGLVDKAGPMGILETSRQVRIAMSQAHDLVNELESQL